MRIKIQCDADRRVSKRLTGNLRMHAGGKNLRCMKVPEIMETNSTQRGLGEQPRPFVGQRNGLQRLAVDLATTNEFSSGRIPSSAWARRCRFNSSKTVKERATVRALPSVPDLLCALPDRQSGIPQIDILPAERKYLASSQPTEGRQQGRRSRRPEPQPRSSTSCRSSSGICLTKTRSIQNRRESSGWQFERKRGPA